MKPMMPMPGMTGAYVNINPECTLSIEVVSYETLSDRKGVVEMRVIKNHNPNSGCPYEEGQIFKKLLDFNDENALERLTLD